MSEQSPVKLEPRPILWFTTSVVALFAGAAITWSLQLFFWHGISSWIELVMLLACTAGLAFMSLSVARRKIDTRNAVAIGLLILWVVVADLALANVSLGLFEPQAYGDKNAIVGFLQRGETFPRWFLGTALLKWCYAAVADAPFAERLIPLEVQTYPGFVRAAGIVTMGVSTVFIVLRWPGRLSVVLPTLIPLWFAFSTGYLEYYPFVAWSVVVYLALLFVDPKPIEERPPYVIGIAAAALPLAYVGFAPLSLLLVGTYLATQPKRTLHVVGAGALSFIVLVRLFGPTDVDVFFRDLYGAMRFPDSWTFARYVGHYEAESNFFHTSFALSGKHLADLAYMYLYGGGILFLPLLLASTLMAWRDRTAATPVRQRRLVLAMLLVAWHAYYLCFYIARLGPREDIDLFFQSFIVMAFFTGHLLDRLIDERKLAHEIALPVVAFALGSAIEIIPVLVFAGLPPRP